MKRDRDIELRNADGKIEPCPTCPWRRGSDLAKIPPGKGPQVDHERLEDLAQSCGAYVREPVLTLGSKVMGCHRLDEQCACAGFVISDPAADHLKLRLAMSNRWVAPYGEHIERDDEVFFATWEEMLDWHDPDKTLP